MPLGKGGMGEVFRAHDTKLGRDVALKLLPDTLAYDAERVARFEREAKLLASLNHPNIAAIYGFDEAEGKRFLVLELVEGPTLAERLKTGPLPVEESLEVARQIAEALEAAHEKGVIHRDVKPANVTSTPGGKVKVLDFGLAKVLAEKDPDAQTDPANSPTITENFTRPGAILGTAAYMSPEQAKGKSVDKRTDIWSFGCVLFECLSGKRPFHGETISETLAKVLEAQPDWQALPEATPRSIHVLLRRCLEKDPRRRLRDIGDAGIEIAEAVDLEASSVVSMSAPSRPTVAWSRQALTILVGVLVGVVGFSLVSPFLTRSEPRRVQRFRFNPPVNAHFPTQYGDSLVAISPDGSTIAFVAEREGERQLYVRAMDNLDPEPLTGTEDAHCPFFSPKGDWIAFFTEDQLLKIPTSGGAVVPVCDVRNGISGAWGPGNMIIYGIAGNFPLWQVPATGGTPKLLTELNLVEEMDHDFMEILPDGEAVIFAVMPSSAFTYLEAEIAVRDLRTGERKTLVKGANSPRYSPTGHLLYCRGATLMARPFDLKRLEVTGQEESILSGVAWSAILGTAMYDLSRTGDLVYVPGDVGAGGRRGRVVAVDRGGQMTPLIDKPDFYRFPSVSHDGSRLAICVDAGSMNELRIYELNSSRPPDTLPTSRRSVKPVWSPDDQWICIGSIENGAPALSRISVEATRPALEELLPSGLPRIPAAWAPDGKEILYQEPDAETGWNIWALAFEEGAKPRPVLKTQLNETALAFSPDGRWVAYVSGRTGLGDVFVKSYPDGPPKRVSSDGGFQPLWSRDTEEPELFYRVGNRLMAVPIRTEPKLVIDPAKEMFEIDGWAGLISWSSYDLLPDGRFVLIVQGEDQEEQQDEVVVVVNWSEELKRKFQHQ